MGKHRGKGRGQRTYNPIEAADPEKARREIVDKVARIFTERLAAVEKIARDRATSYFGEELRLKADGTNVEILAHRAIQDAYFSVHWDLKQVSKRLERGIEMESRVRTEYEKRLERAALAGKEAADKAFPGTEED